MLFHGVFLLGSIAYGTASGEIFAGECINKNVTESFPMKLPSGDVMTVERFTCDNHPAVDRREVESSNALERRQSSACSQSNCVCGIPCLFLNCGPPTQTIHAGDCQALGEQLENMSGPFTIPVNEGLGFILQSCEYTAFGSITQSTQYCWHDFGVAALGLLSVCGAQQGVCEGQNNAGFFVNQISL